MNFQNYDDIFNENNYPTFKKDSSNNCMPVDDKPCVCLSGEKYKDCCKKDVEQAVINRQLDSKVINEELEQLYLSKRDKKLISSIVEKKSINKKNISYCSAEKVFNNCNNNDNNVHSHTISKGNILKNLSDDTYLIRFNDHKVFRYDNGKSQISDYYSEISIKDASVTVSFCKIHDEELFSDIEKDGNTEYSNTVIQNLEYSLKAITFDIYYKVMNIRYLSELIKENKNIIRNPDGSESLYFTNYQQDIKTLFELYPIMLRILYELKELKELNVESTLKTVVFELPIQKINFTLSEVIMLDKTYCFINVINSKKPYIIVSYYGDNSSFSIINKLKSQFDLNQKNSYAKIEGLLEFIKILLINGQNIFLNKTAFNNLSDDAKTYLYVVHRQGTNDIPGDIQNKCDEEIMSRLFEF